MGAAKWGDMGNISQDYYRSEMYSFFPELRLCELDWKVNRLATETYSSWYRKRKGKLTVPVKREEDHADSDGGDMVISQAPKRPGPPLESTTYARKVKSSCNALKPPPAQASTHTPAPRETRPQPTPGPCFNSVPSDIPGAAAVALTATNTSTMASISSTPAPLSLPPLASSVSPSTDHVQPLDSNSPDARSTTSLPHMTTTTVTMPVTGALLARTHAAELQLPSHDSEMLTLSPDIQDEDTETGCMDTSEKDIGLAERPNAQTSIKIVDPLVARIVANLARAGEGSRESTTAQASAVPSRKPSESKKATKQMTKMRPNKSTTPRNLYAIFYMAEHPNATTAEFAAAYNDLDEATILEYKEKSKNLKSVAKG
ncbi:hypothetical protein BJV77DRAFT_1009806 [Russula vinacea]|nr:hypothetical protein BJV77DRAFT_1009806 [Russula vinacea]